jgi:16S rRNA processing protein RimM
MGRVAGPYGVRGFVRIQVYTETLDSLLDFEEWLVGRQGGWEHRKVLEADVHGGGLVARFEGINTPEAARVLRGSDVAILRGDLPAPEEDEVYWIDLIGCAVINREGTELGQVTNLLETGANDVLVVVAGSGEVRVERLIPYVAQVVESVDVPARSIRVDWGEDF